MKQRGKSGQAMLEYVLVFTALAAAIAAAVYFARAPKRTAAHATDVICSETL